MLYSTTNGNGFIEAKWLAGLNTIKLVNCRLSKEPPQWSNSSGSSIVKYHLEIDGVFDKIQLFLHLQQCGPIGCTKMNSANHCCGRGIEFNLSFTMDCNPNSGLDEFTRIAVDSCHLSPMLVHQQMLGGALKVAALDISPKVENIVRSQISRLLAVTHLQWAGKMMNIPQLLNRLISYNSPSNIGSC